MSSDLPKFTLRVSYELLQKISYIAEENGRSTNKEIETLIKHYVSAYEKKNGIINFKEKE